MKRSKHSLSHYKLATLDMGRLVPVSLVDCLPGDTIQMSTSALVRLSPLVAPVMHPVTVRFHHWFVPNRLVWALDGRGQGWEDFITGGKDGLGNGAVFPQNGAPVLVTPGSLWDYMGVKPGVTYQTGQLNLMPIRAYNKIYNEFYRDQDLVNELAGDQDVVQKVAWEKDYFTAARPWTQKGPDITIPIGVTAPVTGGTITGTGQPDFTTGADIGKLRTLAGDPTIAPNMAFGTQNIVGNLAWDNPRLTLTGATVDLTGATALDVNELRRAMALQRYQEARAQYGSRYTEYLRYLGVRSSDARLQRPEYLGGGKQTIAFSEVLRTGNESAATTAPIGEMSGHGIAALRSNRFRYFCEEHGFVMTLMSVRPRSMYVDGLAKMWSKRNKEQYYQKELERIGQQEISNGEVFVQGNSTDSDVFGYQDRYSEYRHQYSEVVSEFRNILDYWHLARKFAALPTLNQSFIECDPSKRIFAEQTQQSLWCMISHSIQMRRMVGKITIGRIM